jgi:TolA-binding protein
VEASARIASLSFAAERWDQADRNYRRVATLTPDAKRAAGARKMVGDIAWKREQYEAAAARYDTALAVARAAGDDTLAVALGRLVPASLYRAAEEREKKGDRKQAAAGFERVTRGHAQFEFADRALYRAAGLRAAAGDTANAATDYAWLLRAYPKSPLQADALLESGRCREALGEREAAARAFQTFATRYPEHLQARAARLRAGMLYAGAGQPAAADSQYAVVLQEIHPAAASRRTRRLLPTCGCDAPAWRERRPGRCRTTGTRSSAATRARKPIAPRRCSSSPRRSCRRTKRSSCASRSPHRCSASRRRSRLS